MVLKRPEFQHFTGLSILTILAMTETTSDVSRIAVFAVWRIEIELKVEIPSKEAATSPAVTFWPYFDSFSYSYRRLDKTPA